MHGAVEIRLAGQTRSYRLGLAELEELEEALGMSVFVIAGALATELPFLRIGQWRHILRLGLIGGGMERGAADDATEAMIEAHGPEMCLPMALRVIGAALGKVHSDEPDDPPGEQQAPSESGSTSAPSTLPQP